MSANITKHWQQEADSVQRLSQPMDSQTASVSDAPAFLNADDLERQVTYTYDPSQTTDDSQPALVVSAYVVDPSQQNVSGPATTTVVKQSGAEGYKISSTVPYTKAAFGLMLLSSVWSITSIFLEQWHVVDVDESDHDTHAGPAYLTLTRGMHFVKATNIDQPVFDEQFFDKDGLVERQNFKVDMRPPRNWYQTSMCQYRNTKDPPPSYANSCDVIKSICFWTHICMVLFILGFLGQCVCVVYLYAAWRFRCKHSGVLKIAAVASSLFICASIVLYGIHTREYGRLWDDIKGKPLDQEGITSDFMALSFGWVYWLSVLNSFFCIVLMMIVVTNPTFTFHTEDEELVTKYDSHSSSQKTSGIDGIPLVQGSLVGIPSAE